jgi:hypothetical protein
MDPTACIRVIARVFLKTMSFLLNQIARHKADTPTRILYISFLLIPFSHPVNICSMFIGGVILKKNLCDPPHKSSHWTIKEKVLDGFSHITETTF